MSRLLALLFLGIASAGNRVWSVQYGCDNDNGAHTWCSGNDLSEDFEYATSATGQFRHNDARVSSKDTYVYHTWNFTALATVYTGEVEFRVWIPTEHSSGIALYSYECEGPRGADDVFAQGFWSIDQAEYRGEWVVLGTLGSVSNSIPRGSLCRIVLHGSMLDEGEEVSADYAEMRVRYDPDDPLNQ